MNDYQYGNMLRTLKKSSDKVYLEFIKGEKPHTLGKLRHTMKIVPKRIKQTQEFKDILSEAISVCCHNFINKKRRRYGQEGKEFPAALTLVAAHIDDATKATIANKLGDLLPKFYPYARKLMLNVAADWVKTEQDALNLLEKNYRTLDGVTLDALVSKVESGYEHDTIKRLSNKGMAFKAKKFNTSDLSDPEIRKQFLNNIAETPSLLTKISSDIHLTLDDFKCLPPARRFKFIQTLFEPTVKRFKSKSRYSYYGRRRNTNYTSVEIAASLIKNYNTPTEDAWFQKVSIDDISSEDLESLLFSVSIKKNQEVVEWMERYKIYSKQRKEVREILKNALKWV